MRRYATSSLGPEENTACRWDNLLNYDRYIWSERENADQENCLFDWHFRAFKFGVIHVATSLINDTREWSSINTFQFASVRRKLSLNFHLGPWRPSICIDPWAIYFVTTWANGEHVYGNAREAITQGVTENLADREEWAKANNKEFFQQWICKIDWRTCDGKQRNWWRWKI